jgi:hypothetical protein
MKKIFIDIDMSSGLERIVTNNMKIIQDEMQERIDKVNMSDCGVEIYLTGHQDYLKFYNLTKKDISDLADRMLLSATARAINNLIDKYGLEDEI